MKGDVLADVQGKPVRVDDVASGFNYVVAVGDEIVKGWAPTRKQAEQRGYDVLEEI